ncbi:hypothetical protein KA005_69530, partial [bacterium]|nr:hypothetical protein [bacterium]
LRRASDIITDERYEFCVLGERALRFLIQGDNQKAKQMLTPTKTVDAFRMAATHLGIVYLRLLSELLWFEMTLGKNLEVLDTLLSNADDPVKELDDLIRKALVLFVYLDRESATTTIDQAISRLQSLEVETGPINSNILRVGAWVYQQKGMICDDQAALLKACDRYEDLLALSDDSNYSSAINQSLGHLYDHLGDKQKANKYFQIAYDLAPTRWDGAVIDLANSYAALGDTKKAQESIAKLQLDTIEGALKIDYYTVLTQIAIQDKDRDLAKSLQQEILELKVTAPIFRELMSNNRLALMDMVADNKDSSTILQSLREAISKYFVLQPNFFGLGINLNELIAPKRQPRRK